MNDLIKRLALISNHITWGLLFLCTVVVSPTQNVHAQQPVVIDVHSNSDSVDCSIEKGVCNCRVHFEMTVRSFDDVPLKLKCGEAGNWSAQKVTFGRFLDPAARQKIQTVLGNQPTYRGALDHKASIKPRKPYNPAIVKQELDELDRKFTKVANKAADEKAQTRSLKGEARDRFVVRAIDELFETELRERLADARLREPPYEFSALGTGPDFIIERRARHREKLVDYIDWILLNDVYRILGISYNRDFTPERELARGREILALLSGKPKQEFQLLSVEEIKLVKQAVTVTIEAEFTPTGPGKAPDSGWQTAPSFGLSNGDISEVTWHGRFNLEGSRTAWLGFQPGSDPKNLKISAQPKDLVFHQVRGDKGMRYLRVIGPTGIRQFRINLADSSSGGDSVEYREPAATNVNFPF